MSKKFAFIILAFTLPILFLVGCKSKNVKFNVILENINNIEITSLPISDNYNKIINYNEDIENIVKYLNSIHPFITKENPNEYVGQSIIIKINYKDGSTKEYNHFGNKFIKEDDGTFYELKYEEAEKLEVIINNIQ